MKFAPLLRNLVSGPPRALLARRLSGENADILEQFNISHGAVRQTRRPPSALFSILLPSPRPSPRRVFLSPTRDGGRFLLLFFLFVLRNGEYHFSVLLFPFQLDAFANLCPRPLLYSIFRFPAFIEKDTLAGSPGEARLKK